MHVLKPASSMVIVSLLRVKMILYDFFAKYWYERISIAGSKLAKALCLC